MERKSPAPALSANLEILRKGFRIRLSGPTTLRFTASFFALGAQAAQLTATVRGRAGITDVTLPFTPLRVGLTKIEVFERRRGRAGLVDAQPTVVGSPELQTLSVRFVDSKFTRGTVGAADRYSRYSSYSRYSDSTVSRGRNKSGTSRKLPKRKAKKK
jgi:hypothetical protein